jgi:signal transduction histidine kinase
MRNAWNSPSAIAEEDRAYSSDCLMRRRADVDDGLTREMESCRAFEDLLNDLLSALTNASPETLDRHIRHALGRLAARAGVERGSFARFSEDGETLTVTHSFGAPAIPPRFLGELRWYLEQLWSGRCLVMNQLSGDLPHDAGAEREAFRRMRLDSHLAVPVSRGGRIWGVVALASARSRRWMPEDTRRLRLVGEIMATVVQRNDAENTTLRLREELVHVARIAFVGELSVALAHELNQPLMAIRANAQAAQLLMSRQERPQEIADALADIVEGATRAADLIVRLRTLFRRGASEKVRVDINEVVRDALVIARTDAARHGSRLVLRLASDLPRAVADPVQLQQVLLNLIRNAAEAMRSIDPHAREVEVSTARTTSGQIAVAVKDSGPAIDDGAFSRLFRPFQTTKPDGLGIGLVISRSIVEAHGGFLWAERCTTDGLVTQFTLPAELVEPEIPDGV